MDGRYAEIMQRIPFLGHLGASLTRFGEGEAELHLLLRDDYMNGWQVAHGGVLMTLLDSSMGLAAKSLLGERTGHAVEVMTIQMSASFLKSAQGELVASAKVIHRTLAILFCEAAVIEHNGQVCARATAAFKSLTVPTLKHVHLEHAKLSAVTTTASTLPAAPAPAADAALDGV
jgi:uncharacterized protein (TIGR00369 family)